MRQSLEYWLRELEPDSDRCIRFTRSDRNDLLAHFESFRDHLAESNKGKDDALARVEEFNMECKRLLDSSLGKEFGSEGQKIKSARKNLRRLMSLPTTGAADRLRIEGMEYLYESVLYDDCPKCKKPPETRDCVYDIIRSRIAKLEKGEKK
jgi:hypothetical protein